MNEPAFPLHNHGNQTLGMHLLGMTLRDYFAAKAMQSILDQKDTCDGRELTNAAWIAYQMADAMMKARKP